MPERIRFDVPIPPPQRAEIAESLVPLANAGFIVRVVKPEESADDMGWRVLLDSPGRHTSFRVRKNAEPAEWAAAAREFVRGSS